MRQLNATFMLGSPPPPPSAQSRAHRQPRGATRSRGRTGMAAVASISLALLGAGLTAPLAAAADPATGTTSSSYGLGAFSGVVPDGVCGVVATVAGGAGGSAASQSTSAPVAFSNGDAAQITARFPVSPGQVYGGGVGGGGKESGVGHHAFNGGGAGNGSTHVGASGGGYSTLYLGTDLAVLAGGGGGSGGGHPDTSHPFGMGGDAGLPSAPGETAAGQDGTGGNDGGNVVSGGGGGGVSSVAPGGSAGTNGADAGRDGTAGAALQGGDGGPDSNADGSGGGGGGVFGGGGGASTVLENNNNQGITGSGGGGGSSFVASSSTSVTSAGVGALVTQGDGADGSVTLDWVECGYDLAVTKSFVISPAPVGSPDLATFGSTITWTVTVENVGTEPMTKGDIVTLNDTLPGAGATEITDIAVSGGTSAGLGDGAITCDAVVGDAMPATLNCDRPYEPTGGNAGGTRGLNAGETLAVTYTQLVSDAVSTVLANTATVTDRTTEGGGDGPDSATATVTVIGPPTANDDVITGVTVGEPVVFDVLDNDVAAPGPRAPWTLTLCDTDGPITSPYVVNGEGTWTISAPTVGVLAPATLTFTPESGFMGDPTPVSYCITDVNGLSDSATVSADYVQSAADDADLGNTIGDTVEVDVLGNDSGEFDLNSLKIVDGQDLKTSLDVDGQGTWTITDDGTISFTPEAGFEGDPTPISYRVSDKSGDTVSATVTVTYVPVAEDDSDLGNTIGEPVAVDVLDNDDDTGDFDATTVFIVDGSNLVRSLVVAGQGTWEVSASTGRITFTPEAGFAGDPTPILYQVTDTTGDAVTATLTVEYVPAAVDDEQHGGKIGEPVEVDVLGDDSGDFDVASVVIIDPETGDAVKTLTVAGEGTWTVNPTTGALRFTPEVGYTGNPTPVTYQVTDTTGDNVRALAIVTYLPEATDDVKKGNAAGTAVTVDVIGNDKGTFDPTSVMLIHPSSGELVRILKVAGEGTWSVDAVTGKITFAPELGFTGNPTPVRYQVTDVSGNVTTAKVSIEYVAAQMASTGVELAPIMSLGTLVLLLGGAVLWFSRRRKSDAELA